MGCASSSTKKQVADPSVTDSDMGSQNLRVPQASFPAPASQQRISQGGRNKVQLQPGHSLMDWIRLGRSGQDLTGVGGRQMEVTLEELHKHNKEGDAWIAIRGKVYNVTAYLPFHPGGVEELMRGAGKDGTSLFDEVHKWVNAESMLEKCFIGKLKLEQKPMKTSKSKEAISNGQGPPTFLAPATPPEQKPRFDWYQSGKTVSIVVYTKWPNMRDDLVIVDRQDKTLQLDLFIKDSVYTVHIELEREVTDSCQVNVSSDSGKVEVLFQKSAADIQWSTIGRHLDSHNTYIKYRDYNPAYRDCSVEKVEAVTKDTKLFTVSLPRGLRMRIPVGYHVHISHEIAGMQVVRSYTVVLPSLHLDHQDPRIQDGRVLHLMIKVYPDGAFTPWLNTLNPGDSISISNYDGNFDLSRLITCTHLVMFAAGTGFTPMVRLLYHSLVEDRDSARQVKLLFFNKTEEDILWHDQLSALAKSNNRFTYTNCLSAADEKWAGLRGRVDKDMVRDFLPKKGDNLLICACGPLPFTKAVIQYTEELGYKGSTHAFLG